MPVAERPRDDDDVVKEDVLEENATTTPRRVFPDRNRAADDSILRMMRVELQAFIETSARGERERERAKNETATKQNLRLCCIGLLVLGYLYRPNPTSMPFDVRLHYLTTQLPSRALLVLVFVVVPSDGTTTNNEVASDVRDLEESFHRFLHVEIRLTVTNSAIVD